MRNKYIKYSSKIYVINLFKKKRKKEIESDSLSQLVEKGFQKGIHYLQAELMGYLRGKTITIPGRCSGGNY